jgi:hypothetical protein
MLHQKGEKSQGDPSSVPLTPGCSVSPAVGQVLRLIFDKVYPEIFLLHYAEIPVCQLGIKFGLELEQATLACFMLWAVMKLVIPHGKIDVRRTAEQTAGSRPAGSSL